MNEHLSLHSQALLAPRRTGLRAGRDNTLDVLVRIQAPDAPAAGRDRPRPAGGIALVIDRSGSMWGEPLAQAQRCAEFVVSRLRACDLVSVVQFDHRVERLSSALPVGDGAQARGAIARISDGGNTNLYGGWLEGADSLDEAGIDGLKRVILLSDGCANEGRTDSAEIAARCAAWVQRGVTTSTYGLGRHFNEELMVAMARAGEGNHYYGDTTEDLMAPFIEELDLLDSTCLRRLVLKVSAPEDVRVELRNAYPAAAGGWRLPDLAWGAEAWALLRVHVPAARLGGAGAWVPLLDVQAQAHDLDGAAVSMERSRLTLPVLAPAAFDALAEDELVMRRDVELRAAELLQRMRQAAVAGDWDAVEAHLAEGSASLTGNEWVSSILRAMRDIAARRSEATAKEAMYASGKLECRLTAKEESLLCWEAVDAVPSFLRRKPLQGKGDN